MRVVIDHAMPDSAEPMRKRTTELIQSRLAPKRSTAHPVSGMTIDSESR
jgi:hypothetical protein